MWGPFDERPIHTMTARAASKCVES